MEDILSAKLISQVVGDRVDWQQVLVSLESKLIKLLSDNSLSESITTDEDIEMNHEHVQTMGLAKIIAQDATYNANIRTFLKKFVPSKQIMQQHEQKIPLIIAIILKNISERPISE